MQILVYFDLIVFIGAKKNINLPDYPSEFVKKYITVEEAIKGMPKLDSNDGQLEIKSKMKNTSIYQKWLTKKISLNKFIKYLKESRS